MAQVRRNKSARGSVESCGLSTHCRRRNRLKRGGKQGRVARRRIATPVSRHPCPRFLCPCVVSVFVSPPSPETLPLTPANTNTGARLNSHTSRRDAGRVVPRSMPRNRDTGLQNSPARARTHVASPRRVYARVPARIR